jgi:hypothetical protein
MSAVVIAIVDVIFILLLIWRIKASHFHQLRWTLVGTAAIFWSIFAIFLVSVFWEPYYRYFYPSWFRSGGILVLVPLLYGVFALAFHWLALRVPGNPIVFFCLLSGTESMLEHLYGIYGLKILQVPLFQEVSPVSILAFAFPEYVFYWCIVISIAALVQNGWRWLIEQRRTRTTVV